MRDFFYLTIYLNKNQSLKYQLMLIMMVEHKKARSGTEHIGVYDGGNKLYFDRNSREKLRVRMAKYISKGYVSKFSEMKDSYLMALLGSDKYFYKFDYQENLDGDFFWIFEMKDKGYSYQYNGYKRTQEKLQNKANVFILMTLLYYIFSWLFKSPGYKFSNIVGEFIAFLISLKPLILGIGGGLLVLIASKLK